MTMRIATSSRIRVDGRRSVDLAPVPVMRFTTAELQHPKTLHRILSSLVLAHEQVSRAHRSSSRLRATIFEGPVFTAGQDLPPIQHGYGMLVRYLPVRWIGATNTSACEYTETKNNGVQLILHAITSGTCDLEIWPVSL
jgi:hypothetical protein